MAKIMMIHHAPNIGGGSISFIDVIKMLEQRHEVIPCIPVQGSELEKLLGKNKLNPLTFNIPLPTFNYYSGGHSWKTRTFWKGIHNYKYHKEWVNFFKKHSPDIVIVNSSVLVLLGPAIAEAGAKSICFVRETFIEQKYAIGTDLMKKMLNKWFDGVLFLSEYDMKYASLSRPLIEVVTDVVRPNMLSKIERDDACKKIKIKTEEFNVLFMGGISYIKGIDVALESMKYIENENIKLIIAGKTELDSKNKNQKFSFSNFVKYFVNRQTTNFYKRVEKLIEDPAIKNSITIVGLQDDMSYCYSASDLVLFPSNLPHQARPLFETGFYCKPIIISDFVQTQEFIENGVNGYTFKARNSESLAQRIKFLYGNPEEIKNLGFGNEKMKNRKHNYYSEKQKLLVYIEKIYSQ